MPLEAAEYVQLSAEKPSELPATPQQHPQFPPTLQMQQTPASHLSALSDSTNWTAGIAIAQEDVVYCQS